MNDNLKKALLVFGGGIFLFILFKGKKKKKDVGESLNLTTDVNEKAKLINELSKNNTIYKYDKCVFKYCKEILKKIINMFLTIASNIPKTNPKYNTINKMINELDILFKKSNYTKKDHKLFITNFTQIMKEMK